MAEQSLTDARPPAARPAVASPVPGPGKASGGTAGTVLGVYAASVAVHLAVLAMMLPPGWSLRDRLLAWDAALYVDIATDGYPSGFHYRDDGELTGNNLAFFPLFPLLVRSVHRVTGLDAGGVAIAVAHLCLLGALFAVHALLCRLYGERIALTGIVLLAGAQPMAVTFQMAYSESLFLALAAAALLAAHREAWLTAGFLGLLTGLTRPAAFALAVALVVAVVLAVRRDGRLPWRRVAAVVLACAGTPLYLLWVGERLGQLNAWFVIQEAGWGTGWDNGAAFLSFLADTAERGEGWVPVSTAVLLVAAVCATAVAWRRGTWPPLLVYGTVMVVLTLAQSNYYHSKLRLLVPALVFLLPLAVALGRARTRTAVVVLTVATLFGSWYGAHMLTVWQYAI
ncbi:hypothetical protein [Streptomyces sp. NPDC058953]|uniref:hypothetical protein n=1 Tax=unclassified Streptomyces TaxID=2593676 RepID=UPI0036B013AC